MDTALYNVYFKWLLLLAAVFLLSKLLFRHSSNGWRQLSKIKLPPSPIPLPIIGHLHLLSKPFHHSLSQISSRYGPVALLRFGSRPVLLVSSLPAAEECFVGKNDAVFADRPLLLSFKHFGYKHTTLFASPYGPHWRNLRHMTTVQVFSQGRVAAVAAVREEEIRVFIQKLLSGSAEGPGLRKAVMKPVLFELSFNTAMHMMTGKRCHGGEPSSELDSRRFMRVIEEVFKISGGTNPEDFLPFLGWFGKTELKKKLIRFGRELDLGAQDILDGVRREKKLRPDIKVGFGKEAVLHNLLSLQEEEPDYYTDVLIKGIIVAVIIGGGDTSAETTEWAMSLLLNHPDVLMKAREEIDAHVGYERLVCDSDIPNLKYLSNIIDETLRLFPAAPLLLPHQSTEECTVGGYTVPRGTMLLVNVYAMHRDPKVHRDPAVFRPERSDGASDEGEDGQRSIPFGMGKRKCPGEGLAKRFMALTLATLLQCFEWERMGEELVDLREGYGLTLPKAEPLEALYKPRSEMMGVLSQI